MDLADIPTRELRRALTEIRGSVGTVPALRDLLLAEIDRRTDAEPEVSPIEEATAALVSLGPPTGHLDPVQFRPGCGFGSIFSRVAEFNGLGRNETAKRLAICGLYGIDYGEHGRRLDGLCRHRGIDFALLVRSIRAIPIGRWEEIAERLVTEDGDR